MDNRFAGRLYSRILHKYFVRDLWFELQMDAKREAVAFIKEHMRAASMRRDRMDLLRFGLQTGREAHPEGLVCEFGVSAGKTLRFLAGLTNGAVHGFDAFEGLPEEWAGTLEKKGAFSRAGKLPAVPVNAQLHVGWFDKTIPAFLAAHDGPCALLHLDADIYSSTKTALTLMTPRIAPGTVFVFDEYYAYWGWREHEHKALCEWAEETGARFSYIGFAANNGQVALRVEAI
jgi:hypothetical protein